MPVDEKISALPAASALGGTELIPMVQGGIDVAATPAQVKTYVGPGGSSLAIKSQGTQTTSAAVSLNFTTGIGVTDSSGAETIFTYWPSVKDYGATGNGSTDDTADLITAATSGATIVIPPGTYKVTGNLVFGSPVIFLARASLVGSGAIKIQFSGGIAQAPAAKIFTLSGGAAVAFLPTTQLAVLAEWWGAITYSATAYPVSSPTNSDIAIQAAINSGSPLIQLFGGDYYLTAALTMLASNITLQGVGPII